MSIEELVAAIQKERTADGLFVPAPASEQAIGALADQFRADFKFELPEAYRRVLRCSDGILFNGLTIWPTHPYWEFRESLIDANRDLREMIDENYLYFGQRDEVLFLFDTRSSEFLAAELTGLPVWKTFLDCESMMVFMLERALV